MHRGEFLSRLGPCLAHVAPHMQVQELSGPLANRAMCRLLKRLAARVCSWSQSCLCLCNPQRSGHCEGGDHRLWAQAGGKTGRFLWFHLWKVRDHLEQRLYIKWTASQLVCKLIGHIIYMTKANLISSIWFLDCCSGRMCKFAPPGSGKHNMCFLVISETRLSFFSEDNSWS